MAHLTYREYRLKFYLNGRHFIVTNNQRGEIHPHTWEFSLTIRLERNRFTPFDQIENVVDSYLKPFQNQTLNEVAPFDTVMPTLENIADYFADELGELLQNLQCHLMQLEARETPTRSYIVEHHDIKSVSNIPTQENLLDVVDAVLNHLEY